MSYAVSQFYLNGGSEAWIVRLGGAGAAVATTQLPDSNGNPSLVVTAVDEGEAANNIQFTLNDPSTDPTISAKTFNLTLSYNSPDNPSDNRTEVYKGLSIDPANSRFAEDVINGNSLLVTVKAATPTAPATSVLPPAATAVRAGTLTSGVIAAKSIDNLPDDNQKTFKIGFNGNPTSPVTLDTSKQIDPKKSLADQLKDMAGFIQNAVRTAKPSLPAWRGFTCTVSSDGTKLVLTSGTAGGTSSVTIENGDKTDIAKVLQLDKAGNPQPQAGSGPIQMGTGANATQGSDGAPVDINNSPDVFFPNDRTGHTGVYALDKVDIVNLLCLPAVTEPVTLNNAIVYCKSRRAFLIIDAPHPDTTPPGNTPQQMVDFITGPNLAKADDGTYAAIYYPWQQVPDVLNNGKLRSFAPCGMIAGLYATTDGTRGVWKAPAGTNANLVNVQGMDFLLTNDENGELNSLGVNCLRIFPIYGAVCWGARTLSGADAIGSEYKYVPVRRTALYIEESLYRGLQWVVFEPNDEPLWAQIRLNVGAFMHNLFVKGAFQGKTPRDAYFVKCDKETTTQNDIDQGIVNIIVGFAPLKPAEFVVVSIQQIAGQIQV
jgi:phage tail sheath protein FI